MEIFCQSILVATVGGILYTFMSSRHKVKDVPITNDGETEYQNTSQDTDDDITQEYLNETQSQETDFDDRLLQSMTIQSLLERIERLESLINQKAEDEINQILDNAMKDFEKSESSPCSSQDTDKSLCDTSNQETSIQETPTEETSVSDTSNQETSIQHTPISDTPVSDTFTLSTNEEIHNQPKSSQESHE